MLQIPESAKVGNSGVYHCIHGVASGDLMMFIRDDWPMGNTTYHGINYSSLRKRQGLEVERPNSAGKGGEDLAYKSRIEPGQVPSDSIYNSAIKQWRVFTP